MGVSTQNEKCAQKLWNVWNVRNVKTKNGKIQNENKMGKRKKRNIKFSKNLWKIIFENFVI